MHALSVCSDKVKVRGSVYDSPPLKRELRASKGCEQESGKAQIENSGKARIGDHTTSFSEGSACLRVNRRFEDK